MHTNNKYYEAKELRKKGFSYSEISKEINIPKSTLSYWFSKKAWSQKVKKRIIKRQKNISKTTQILANKARLLKKELRQNRFRKEARKEFKKLKSTPLFLVGLGIYWGEGEKVGQGRVSVINTDPKLLLVMVNFYRNILNISENKLRIALFVYNDIDINTVTNYWSRTLKIPQQQFIKTQMLKSRSKRTKRKSKYGICNLYFSSTEQSIKISEWIKLLNQ